MQSQTRRPLSRSTVLLALVPLGAGATVVAPSALAVQASPSATAPASRTVTGTKATSHSVAPVGLTVTDDPDYPAGTPVATDTVVGITANWGVPSTAKAGDTTAITLPAAYTGNSITGMSIKDAKTGAVVGTLRGSGHHYTVTYTSYVETHTNVHVSTTLAARIDGSGLTDQQPLDISLTVGGVTGTAGQYEYDSDSSDLLLPLHVHQVMSTTGTYDMEVDSFAIPTDGNAAGKDVTITYRLPNPSDTDPSILTTPYATFDDTVLAPGATINYEVYDYTGSSLNEAKKLGTYSTGVQVGPRNPLGLKIVSSTNDTVVLTYRSPADPTKELLIRPVLQDPTSKEGGIRLKPGAVASQHTGPYATDVFTDFDGDGYPQYSNGTVSYGFYVFDSAMASGDLPSVVAAPIATSVHAGSWVTVDVPGSTTLGKGVTIKSVTITDANGHPVTSDGNGTWTVGPDDKPVFTAKAGDRAGTERVRYTVTDSTGATSTSTIAVTIVPVAAPMAPTASGVVFSTPENTPVTLDLGAHVKPASGATITSIMLKDPKTGALVKSVTVPGVGTLRLTGTGGQAVFTPAHGYTGAAPIFTVVATDSNGQHATFAVTGVIKATKGNATGPVAPGQPAHPGHPGHGSVTPTGPNGPAAPAHPAVPGHVGRPGSRPAPVVTASPSVGPKVQTDLTAVAGGRGGLGADGVAGFVLVSIAGGYVLRRRRS